MTDDVYVALVRTLFSRLLPTLIMATSFVVIGGWITIETRDPLLLTLLLAAGLALMWRVAVLVLHRHEVQSPRFDAARAGQIERRFAFPFMGFALFFGLFAARAFTIGSSDARLMLIGLLFGYGAGVAAGLSLRPWIAIPSVLVAITPTIFAGMFLPGPGNWGIGLLTAIFLAGGIESMLRRHQATSRQFALQSLLATVDRRDELTGLPNQISLRERFGQLTASTPGAELIAVHCLLLDRVEAVNDDLGYPAGDALLKAVAERLTRILGPDEFAIRLGGAEFAIVQSGILQPRRAERLARRIVAGVTKPYLLTGRDISIAAHIGYALDVQQAADLDRLLAIVLRTARRARQEGRVVVAEYRPRWTADAPQAWSGSIRRGAQA